MSGRIKFHVNFMHGFGIQILTHWCDFLHLQINMNSHMVSVDFLAGNQYICFVFSCSYTELETNALLAGHRLWINSGKWCGLLGPENWMGCLKCQRRPKEIQRGDHFLRMISASRLRRHYFYSDKEDDR